MGQGFVFGSVFSPIFHSFICIFELRAQALSFNTLILLFVDNGLLISQNKTYNTILLGLYSSYKVVIWLGHRA